MNAKNQIILNKIEQCMTAIALISIAVLSDMAGKYGAAYLGNVISVIVILYVLFCIAIPKTTYKLFRVRFAKQQLQNAKIIFKNCMLLTLAFHVALDFIIILLAKPMIHLVMPETSFPLGISLLAPAMLFLSLSGIIRAYFQCFNRILTIIISKCIGLVAFLLVTFLFYVSLNRYGLRVDALLKTQNNAGQYGATALSIGVLVASVISLFYLLWMYLVYRPFMSKQIAQDMSRFREGRRASANLFIKNLFPDFIYFFSCYLFPLGAYIVYVVSRHLVLKSGAESIDYWGYFLTLYIAILVIPFLFVKAFSLENQLFLKKALKEEDFRSCRLALWNKTHKIFCISVTLAVLVLVFSQNITFLVTGTDSGALLKCTMILAAAMLVVPLTGFYHFIIKTLGHGSKLVISNLIAAICSLLLLLLLINLNSLGIINVAIAASVHCFLLGFFNFVILQKIMRFSGNYIKLLCFPFVSAGIMGIILLLINKAISNIESQMLNGLYLLLMLFIGFLIDIILLLVLHGIEEAELEDTFSGKLIHKIGELLHIF